MAFVCVDTPPTHSGDADLSRCLEGGRGTARPGRADRAHHEEHRAGRDGRPRAGAPRPGGPCARRLRLEPGVPGRRQRSRRLPKSRPRRHRGVRRGGRGRRRRPLHVCRGRHSADGRRVGGNGQDGLERVPRHARQFHQRDRKRVRGDGRRCLAVARGVGLDRRLGSHFLRAGIGYWRQLLPQGHLGAQATRCQLGLPLPAAHGCHRGERAPEATRRREAREAPRFAPRDDDRPARAGIQAEHERHPRSAEPRARVSSDRRRRDCARLGPRRARRGEGSASRHHGQRTTCWRR